MPTQDFHAIAQDEAETALSALARVSGLPKGRIKDAMQKGAVWLKRGKHTRRLRRSTSTMRAGDSLVMHYNPEILALKAPAPTLLANEGSYSVWVKPAGLLAQGSKEGDHCSLLRIAEQQLNRELKLVHRLDREASGLMMIAHTSNAAAALSAMFASSEGKIQKLYEIEVKGELPLQGEFSSPLDGKAAITRYQRSSYDEERQSSQAQIELITGRKHQIRRHFAEAGFPVLGDPQYGTQNKDPRGLQLRAVKLSFICPLSKRQRDYCLNS